MYRGMERLESRMLLSAVPPQVMTLMTDRATLLADVKAVRADIKTCQLTEAADLRAVTKDLKSAKTAQNRALLTTLRTDDKACIRTLTTDLKTLFGHGSKDVNHALKDARLVLKNPSDAAARAKLTADLSSLQTDATGSHLAAEVAACQTTENADLNAIASANPSNTQLQTDVGTAHSDAGTCSTAVQTAASTLATDIAKFVTDAGAV